MSVRNRENKPHRDMKALWLLPLLALGIGTLIATRKPLPSDKSKPMTPQMMKAEAFQNAKRLAGNQIMESDPGSVYIRGFGPYNANSVIPLGQGRFRCSSFLLAQSRTGAKWRERWQCIVWTYRGYWMCKDLQETHREQIAPGRAVRNGRKHGNARTPPP